MTTITVTTTADMSDGTVTPTSATISLRDAIVYSENNAGTTIDLPSGTFTLNSDLPLISQSTTFVGSTIALPGNTLVTTSINGQSDFRGFLIAGIAADGKNALATTVSISDIDFDDTAAIGGSGGGSGGGGLGAGGALFIGPAANVTLTAVSFTDDQAVGGTGGNGGAGGGGGGLGGAGSGLTAGGGGGIFTNGGRGGGGITSVGSNGSFGSPVGAGGVGLVANGGTLGGGGGSGGGGVNGGTGAANGTSHSGGNGGFGGGGGGGYGYGAGNFQSGDGGVGGFGGGGGAYGIGGTGAGGFGGGGGGGLSSAYTMAYTFGGKGGFGGGGGGGSKGNTSTFGGGNGGGNYGGGGGGAGLGGAVFVASGGSLTIDGGSNESADTVSGGSGEDGGSGGVADGSGIFYEGGTSASPATLTFGGGSEQIVDSITDLNGAANNDTSANGLGATGGFTAVLKTGSGRLTLGGDNTYTGGTTAAAGGTVYIKSDFNLGNPASGLSLNNGTLETAATLTSIRAFALTGTGTVQVDTGTTDLMGIVGGTGSLQKSGSGTLALLSRNSYSGGTTITDGVLQLNVTGTAGKGAITFAAAAGDTTTLDIQYQAGDVTFANTLSQFGTSDTIEVLGLAYKAGASAIYNAQSDLLTVTSNGMSENFTLASPGATHYYAHDNGSGDTLVNNIACFCRGTHILTARGELPVEMLTIGDRVVTKAGLHRRIKWLGRRSYAGRFLAANPNVMPILFQAGALDGLLPHRDLLVSPKHAMFLDGLLIPAECLVNGTTINKVGIMELVEYHHLELETHDVILAEGAASETFVEDGGRAAFHNAAEYARLYPQDVPSAAIYCAPRVEGGFALETVRQRLAILASRKRAIAA